MRLSAVGGRHAILEDAVRMSDVTGCVSPPCDPRLARPTIECMAEPADAWHRSSDKSSPFQGTG